MCVVSESVKTNKFCHSVNDVIFSCYRHTFYPNYIIFRPAITYFVLIPLFRERLSEKSTKVHATRPKGGLGIYWNFAYLPRGNVQVCVFARAYLCYVMLLFHYCAILPY